MLYLFADASHVIYLGLHHPVPDTYLKSLEAQLPELPVAHGETTSGVTAVARSQPGLPSEQENASPFSASESTSGEQLATSIAKNAKLRLHFFTVSTLRNQPPNVKFTGPRCLRVQWNALCTPGMGVNLWGGSPL
jgi:hypothetical protein